jgi:tetrapyrrole methylase family protein/MazG family protein/ATP diphosphatase
MQRFDHRAAREVADTETQDGRTLPRLVALMQRLLAPDGCPWDREQTLLSLRRYLLEETCEVLDTLDEDDVPHHREELGDLLLQIVFQAELRRAQRAFAIDDVIEGIVAKLVRRHPHIFPTEESASSEGQAQTQHGQAPPLSAAEVRATWDELKRREKGERPLLANIPHNLPALMRATTIGKRVAEVGFDWPDAEGSWQKVQEELGELRAAVAEGPGVGTDAVEAELGDVLFALVNLSRHLGVDAERALQRTNAKFTRRFAHVEARVRSEHGGFAAKPSLAVLDHYWEEAKSHES